MKNVTSLAGAIAVIAASQASAQTLMVPAEITAARTAGTLVEIDISGASAVRTPLSEVLVGKCEPGTLVRYRDKVGNSNPGGRYNNFACQNRADQSDSLFTFSDLAPLAPIYISNQSPGSFEGVGPVARAEAVEFMNVEAGNCAENVGDSTAAITFYDCEIATEADIDGVDIVDATNSATPTPNRERRWFCTGDNPDVVGTTAGINSNQDRFSVYNTRCTTAMGGVSDEEPAQFTFGVNSPAPLSGAEAGLLNSATLFAQPFAAVVSTVFADALPRTAVQANGFDYPILPKAFIRASFALGSSTTAADVTDALPNEFAERLVVCRRNLGSGTHVAQNLFYMASPCKAPVGGSVLFDSIDVDVDVDLKGDAGFGPFFDDLHLTVGGQGSSDMEECYEDAQDGTLAFALDDEGAFDDIPDGTALSALGYQSYGRKSTGLGEGETVANGARWQYVATDGVAPTIENAASGAYEHFWEATLQWCDGAACTNTPTATQIDVLADIRASAGTTTYVAATNSGNDILATSGTDVVVTDDLAASAIKARYLRFGDSCREPSPNGISPLPAIYTP